MLTNNRHTRELLRRFLSGEITAPEEAELERRAREDEELAGAMTAIAEHPEVDHAAHVRSTVGKIREKYPVSNQRTTIYRLAAAASVLLLAVAAIFFLPGSLEESSGEVAMMEEITENAPEPKREMQPAVAPVTTQEETPMDDAAPVTDVAPPIAIGAPPPPPAAEPIRAKVSPPAPETRPDVSRKVQPVPSIAEELAEAEYSAPPPEMEAEADQIARAQKQDNQQDLTRRVTTFAAPPSPQQGAVMPPKFLEGRITDEAGKPVFNALVRRPGQPLGERTDTSGLFRLPLDATLTEVVVNHPRFEEEEVELFSTGERLQISLTPADRARQSDQPAWLETVGKTKITIDPLKRTGYAAPLEGYTELRQRIETGKPDSVSAGKVKVSFLVNDDGTLTDFKFRSRADEPTLNYVGETLVETSAWTVVNGQGPVRVYLIFRFD